MYCFNLKNTEDSSTQLVLHNLVPSCNNYFKCPFSRSDIIRIYAVGELLAILGKIKHAILHGNQLEACTISQLV